MIPPIASRFIAGETMAEAIERAHELNERDVGAILNVLGEHYDHRDPVDEDTTTYHQLLSDIADTGLDACISVKPSQLGLRIDDTVFRENAERITERAADYDGFVWFDMEDHTTTDATLDTYEALATDYPGDVGVCVQANLKRTRADLDRLATVRGKVRLVKGAYNPPPAIGYREKERINDVYEEYLAYMFREFDGGIAVGSHDPRMIDRAIELHDHYGTDFEIQMLMGVRENAQYDLARDHAVWQYVPYGEKWLSYFYRRVMERTENLQFALRAILGR